MEKEYDVIIIGAGFLGLSSAYQLSKLGMRTLVLDAGTIGGGTFAKVTLIHSISS